VTGSDLQTIKRAPRTRSLTGSLTTLFRHKKPLTTFDRRPNDYWGHIYVTKSLYEAIDFLAIANRRTKKKMVEELLNIGIAHYLGNKVSESNRQEIAQRKQGMPVRATPFIYQLRRWAKAKGKDIDKFF
jgi:hypothetical protein